MLDFAVRVALRSSTIDEADAARLREHGFTDEDAWDIGAIAASFATSNRLANLTGMGPNDGSPSRPGNWWQRTRFTRRNDRAIHRHDPRAMIQILID